MIKKYKFNDEKMEVAKVQLWKDPDFITLETGPFKGESFTLHRDDVLALAQHFDLIIEPSRKKGEPGSSEIRLGKTIWRNQGIEEGRQKLQEEICVLLGVIDEI